MFEVSWLSVQMTDVMCLFQAGESFLAVLFATASTYGVITLKNSPKLAKESPDVYKRQMQLELNY